MLRETTRRVLTTALAQESPGGLPGWRDRSGSAEIRFLGRGEQGVRESDVAWLGRNRPQAWMRQVHGAKVLAGRSGECGEGDALATSTRGLALSVVTADCVPVLLAADDRVAAVHAGWRGFVGGVVAAALAEFADAGAVVAWIGPAIGACCYEVGEEVAAPVAARSSAAVRLSGRRGRPHIDLPLAVEIELARLGVGEVRRLAVCTACHPETLESYRRDGAAAGRNRSFIWLREGFGTQDD